MNFRHDRTEEWQAGVTRWSTHPDWRVREWAAWHWRLAVGMVDSNTMMAMIHNQVDPTGRDLPRGPGWDALGDLFALDSHPAVRAHVLADERNPRVRDTARWQTQLDATWDGAGQALTSGDPHAIAELPWAERRLVASGTFGAAPRILLEDPLCVIRVDAVGHVDPALVSPGLLAWMHTDPCPKVAAQIVDVYGTPDAPAVVVGLPKARTEIATTSTDPDLLTALAGDPAVTVRAAVASNGHTPVAVIAGLYTDPQMPVWVAAKNNRSWPGALDLTDPLADHGLVSKGIKSQQLGAIILRTQAHVTCTQDYGRCGADAVLLDTYCPSCTAHLVDAHEDNDLYDTYGGYYHLAQRLADGLWVPLGFDTPLAPSDQLWHPRR